jgi:ankyrin repeat protein
MAAVLAGGRLEIAEILIQHGADIDAKNAQGRTALMFAAGDNETDMARLLLAHGANPKIADKQGWTALRLAATHDAFNRDTQRIKALLRQYGAK